MNIWTKPIIPLICETLSSANNSDVPWLSKASPCSPKNIFFTNASANCINIKPATPHINAFLVFPASSSFEFDINFIAEINITNKAIPLIRNLIRSTINRKGLAIVAIPFCL